MNDLVTHIASIASVAAITYALGRIFFRFVSPPYEIHLQVPDEQAELHIRDFRHLSNEDIRRLKIADHRQ